MGKRRCGNEIGVEHSGVGIGDDVFLDGEHLGKLLRWNANIDERNRGRCGLEQWRERRERQWWLIYGRRRRFYFHSGCRMYTVDMYGAQCELRPGDGSEMRGAR